MIRYTTFTQQEVLDHMAGLVKILCDVVEGGASVNFIAPLSPIEAEKFWRRVSDAVGKKEIILLVALENGLICGTVQLALAWQPNGPHRAEIQKLLVHSSKRRQGIATKLMQLAEETALTQGRWLLYLDTERESEAVHFYKKMGYQQAGVIEQFALNATGEIWIDTVIFSKRLRG